MGKFLTRETYNGDVEEFDTLEGATKHAHAVLTDAADAGEDITEVEVYKRVATVEAEPGEVKITVNAEL